MNREDFPVVCMKIPLNTTQHVITEYTKRTTRRGAN